VSKSGSFFSYGNDRLGQGRANAKAYLEENPATAKEIQDKVYAALAIDTDLVAPIDRDAAPAVEGDVVPEIVGRAA
jgi:recombination protein RecA